MIGPSARRRPARSLCVTLGLVWAAAASAQTVPAVPVPAAPPSAVSPTAVGVSLPSSAVLRAHKLRGLTGEVAGLILKSETGGDLGIAALALPLAGTGESARVAVYVEIDGASLLAQNQAETARVEVYAYALKLPAEGGQTPGAVAGFLAEAFAVNVKKLGEVVWESGLKFHGHLDLPAGRYTLRVLVRLFQSGAYGLRVMPLEVPELADGGMTPVFTGPRQRDSWLAVRRSETAAGESSVAAGEPFIAGGRAISPAARPMLIAGRPARAHLFLRRPPSGATAGKVQFVSRGGDVLAEADLDLGPPEAPAADGLAAPDGGLIGLPMRFTPPSLPRGDYTLRVDLRDPTGASRRSVGVPVFLLEKQTRERELLWTDLRSLAAPSATKSVAAVRLTAPPAPAKGKQRNRRARREKNESPAADRGVELKAQEYRAVLTTLAGKSPAAARDALLDLESAALGRADGGKDLELLAVAQAKVATRLAATDPESLLPAMMLHTRLYETYSRRRLYSLISHSRNTIEKFAGIYVDAGGSGTVAAQVLAGLAGYLQRANLPGGSRRYFQRALGYDPLCPGALLGLAASFEKYGDYTEAIYYLDPLAEAHPELSEGLLRLALNHDRRSEKRRSRELLLAVVEQPSPDWVKSLAYQELARAHLATGTLDEALALLEAAVEQLPGERGLTVLLAHVYDRLRRPQQALDLIAAMAPAAAGSARWIYDSWPRAVLDRDRGVLDEAAEQHRATLARVLRPSAGEKG